MKDKRCKFYYINLISDWMLIWILTTFIPEEYVEPTLDFLRSRFHPELPHIGTVGTADVDEEVDGDLDDFEEFEEKDVE